MNPRVSALIDQFRTHFRSDMPDRIPAALRQESSSVVFVALLEEDKPPAPPPMMSMNPMDQMGMGDMGMGGMGGMEDMGLPMGLPPLPGSDQMMGSAEDPMMGGAAGAMTMDSLLGAPGGAMGGPEGAVASPLAPGAPATPVNPLERF